MISRVTLISVLAIGFLRTYGYSQQLQVPPLYRGDEPYILFTLPGETDLSNQPGQTEIVTLEPVAFVVHGELRDCYSPTVSPTATNPGEEEADKQLRKAYTRPEKYSVWLRGTQWGQASAIKSCMENSFAKDGCFQLRTDAGQTALPKQMSATSYTGPISSQGHQTVRAKASEADRTLFLEAAAAEYAKRHIRAAPNSIHVGTIWKTQLRNNHIALVGSTLYQFALKEKGQWSSDRIFLVIEEQEDKYSPILASFHRARISISPDNPAPKLGERLLGEDSYDVEEFLDNFPLFPNEPDAIISEHAYDEAAAFSIYRWRKNHYELVFTGCGGGE